MPATPTGGVHDTSPPTSFAYKSRSQKETAETLFETSVSLVTAGTVCSHSEDSVYTNVAKSRVGGVSRNEQ